MRIARRRAHAMNAAVPDGTGTMAAVLGLDDATVEQLCTHCADGGILEPVNYNAPGQVVVAGHVSAIERLTRAARDAGAKMVYLLPVSGPFHSSLMRPAAHILETALGAIDVHPPLLRVLHNSSMALATAASIKSELVAQLTSPVRWAETVRTMTAAGTSHILEMGSGEVLSGLCRRIAPGVTTWPLGVPQGMDAAASALG
jgi:[acyl-carrier-protein] S-malonyltransferase